MAENIGSKKQHALKVHHLRPAPGSHQSKTRVGRGEASKGKTAGRGTKGTGARQGGGKAPYFEGGQLPHGSRFAVVSVLMGGNYWHHYLVELIVPLSVAIGVLAARRGFAARPLIAYVAVAGSVCWALNLTADQGNVGQTVGRTVAASARVKMA